MIPEKVEAVFLFWVDVPWLQVFIDQKDEEFRGLSWKHNCCVPRGIYVVDLHLALS